jgi:hypothetical protein
VQAGIHEITANVISNVFVIKLAHQFAFLCLSIMILILYVEFKIITPSAKKGVGLLHACIS